MNRGFRAMVCDVRCVRCVRRGVKCCVLATRARCVRSKVVSVVLLLSAESYISKAQIRLCKRCLRWSAAYALLQTHVTLRALLVLRLSITGCGMRTLELRPRPHVHGLPTPTAFRSASDLKRQFFLRSTWASFLRLSSTR